MPTKSEAAEALHRAAMKLITDCQQDLADYLCPANRITEHDAVNKLLGRLDGPQSREVGKLAREHRDATPDPLPAEVQRVVEAAGHVIHTTRMNHPDAADAWGDLESAVEAYRSTQPEPLSARLARLRPGSVVTDVDGDPITVIAVDEPTQRIFGAWEGKTSKRRCTGLFEFRHITAILSESP